MGTRYLIDTNAIIRDFNDDIIITRKVRFTPDKNVHLTTLNIIVDAIHHQIADQLDHAPPINHHL